MFIHNVFFWLNPNTSAAAAQAMVGDVAGSLAKIPTVRHIWAGKPVATDRTVVDASYTIGLTVVFDDRAGHDTYQDHPRHLEFIARHKAAWHKIKVYDFA